MKFTQTAQIPVAREPLWDFLMDVPKVAKSLPGVESVSKIDDTTYQGALTVRVGPIKLNLQGKIILEEQNKNDWRAALRAEAWITTSGKRLPSRDTRPRDSAALPARPAARR